MYRASSFSLIVLTFLTLLFASITGCSSRPQNSRNDEDGPAVFFPPPPEVPRLQFLASYTREEDVTGGSSSFRNFVMGDEKQQEAGIIKPYGVSMSEGSILVCDTAWRRVWELDLIDHEMRAMSAGEGGSELRKPVNVAVDVDAKRYVVDVGLKRVIVFDSHGKFVKAIGDPEKWSPTAVAIHNTELYVTDVTAGQVVVFDKETTVEVRRIGTRGSADGQLFLPTNIAVAPSGHILVSDTGNFRVVEFDATGKFLRNLGSLGRAPGQFARPKGIAVDREGRMYVVDTAFENVQIFDAEGRLLMFFGFPGAGPGAINLPADVAIDYDNTSYFDSKVAPGKKLEYLVLVTSQYGPNKVNVYGFLKPEDGKP